MKKNQIAVYLLIGIVAGLLVTACAGVTNGTLTVPGNTVGTGITFQQVQAPLLTINLTARNAVFESEMLATRQIETLMQVSAAMQTQPAADIFATTLHHCQLDP